ncbi:unnamed protein product [Hydatigera taeniaeformis]|uniref:Uncharacterized protein n=1 Tax=Hydatigena taeniaeformis TaxID=6205 RepID=A0A0R3WUJ0_HYDTA|nr:unnamed protein product [Hydatigera taeniaeformis]
MEFCESALCTSFLFYRRLQRFKAKFPIHSRRSGITNALFVNLPTGPDVALVEPTYRALRQREKDIKNRGGPIVHEDFVQRNAAFEVDA